MKHLRMLFSLMMISLLVFHSCELDDPEDDDNEDGNLITITENITSNTVWLESKKYYINSAVDVENGATLTIEPGTVITFGPYGSLDIGYIGNATLIANGTAAKPITFTSSAANPTPGAWDYVYFGAHTLQNTSLSYCIFEYGGKNAYYGVLTVADCKISVNNCTFRNNSGDQTLLVSGGDEIDGFAAFANNTFSNNASHAIRIPAQFAHQISSNNIITCAVNKGVAINGDFHQATATLNKLSVPYISENSYGTFIKGFLTIAPGTVMMFSGDDYLGLEDANARLLAQGTANERIVLTTSSSSPAPGAWGGVFFFSAAHPDCILSYCDILYAGRDNYYKGAVTVSDLTVTVSNCKMENSARYGIYLMGSEGALSANSTGNSFNACALGNNGTDMLE
jgi:hypothetical protein